MNIGRFFSFFTCSGLSLGFHPSISRHERVEASFTWLFWLIGMALLAAACTGGGRVPSSAPMTDHDMPDREQIWIRQKRLLTPGAYAPLIRLPFLFPKSDIDAQLLDSVNHVSHVVLFWASWCSDCREEIPSLVSLQKSLPSLPWLTVSLDNEAVKAQQYVWKSHLQGIHLFDGRDWRGEACTDYAVPLHGIPFMVLIDEEGKVVWSGSETDSLAQHIR